jgi:hypothetical protein
MEIFGFLLLILSFVIHRYVNNVFSIYISVLLAILGLFVIKKGRSKKDK